MSKKGVFNLPDIGRSGARDESVRRTARAFFDEEVSSPRGDSSPGQGAAGARRQRDDTQRAVPAARADTSEGVDVSPGEAKKAKSATWRAPRADGRLRANDRAVLVYLRTRIPGGDDDTTEEVSMREIAAECEVSHRTAQNTLLRLQQAGKLARIAAPLGSNRGCRYRIAGVNGR